MSPYAIVRGNEGEPIFSTGILPGEVDEHERALWVNSIITASDILILVEHGSSHHEVADAVNVIAKYTCMPRDIAEKLVEAGVQRKTGFRVECNTIFENGGIGGKRHYENFRIK